MEMMSSEDPFVAGLDFVLGVLKERREAGIQLKASASALKGLRQLAVLPPSDKAIRFSGDAGSKSKRPVAHEPGEPVQGKSRGAAVASEGAPMVESFTGDKREALAGLRAETARCEKCPNLARSRFSVVFGEGDPEAELMFVGEAPGADEDAQGKPFVGAAGELLGKMIGAMGLSRERVYIANVLKCRPDMPEGVPGNRKPTGEEMERCLPFLRKQISIVQPRVMVALGATAMQGLFGRTEAMGRLRAQWHDFGGIPVMATYHPSYLLRNQAASEKRKVWEDLMQVMERLGLPISDKQRAFFLPRRD